ncbi:MAG: NAD(P)-binding protein, partial [Desulfobacterales bacterium]|nr:NAD(P)-binding protein [Desulfobacterales bacterium]
MKYDYAVIGAGVSGMSAAIILSQKGYRTALIEKSGTTGPTIRGFTRHGVFFDTGFHYTGAFGNGEPLDRLFRYIGISGKILRIPFDRNGVDLFRCLEPSFEFSHPCGLKNIRERLNDAFPQECKAVTAYLQLIWKVYQRLPYINLDLEMTSFALPFGSHEESLGEVLDRLTANT